MTYTLDGIPNDVLTSDTIGARRFKVSSTSVPIQYTKNSTYLAGKLIQEVTTYPNCDVVYVKDFTYDSDGNLIQEYGYYVNQGDCAYELDFSAECNSQYLGAI